MSGWPQLLQTDGPWMACHESFMSALWVVYEWLMSGKLWPTYRVAVWTADWLVGQLYMDMHAKLTVYELFMRGSWEVYEWLMSRRRVANAAQPLILDFFTSFNYQHICRIRCFGFNTFTRTVIHNALLWMFLRAAQGFHIAPEYPIYQIHEWRRKISQQA